MKTMLHQRQDLGAKWKIHSRKLMKFYSRLPKDRKIQITKNALKVYQVIHRNRKGIMSKFQIANKIYLLNQSNRK